MGLEAINTKNSTTSSYNKHVPSSSTLQITKNKPYKALSPNLKIIQTLNDGETKNNDNKNSQIKTNLEEMISNISSKTNIPLRDKKYTTHNNNGNEIETIQNIPLRDKKQSLTDKKYTTHNNNGNEIETGKKVIYMDYQATTPMDPRVLDAMMPYLTSHFGNPHSRTHTFGWTSEKAITTARNQISNLINATPNEIIFTSGATESNNLALKGLAMFHIQQNIKPHFITLQTEHKCVLDSLRVLQELGCEVTYLPVQTDGQVDIDLLRNSIQKNTICVSIMAVNNEIGVIQDLKSIGQVCKDNNIVFHCDAAQAFGKIGLNVRDLNIGLMSISGHKIYGPKGIGALFVNKRDFTLNRPRLRAIISGGGQEFGLRSGTVPVALAVGLGKAADILKNEMCRDFWYVEKLSKKLCSYLKKHLTEISHNGSGSLCGEKNLEKTPVENFHANSDKLQQIESQKNTIIDEKKMEKTSVENYNANPDKLQQIESQKNSIIDQKTSVENFNANSDQFQQIESQKNSVSDEKNLVMSETKIHSSKNTQSSNLTDINDTNIRPYKNITPENTMRRKWYPGCLNLSFSYVEGEGLMMKLNNIALSSGSACTSSSLEPSYTLRALSVGDENAHSSIRFGISKFTTKDDIEEVGKRVVESVNELRELSPLYEMVNEGIDLKSIQWSQE